MLTLLVKRRLYEMLATAEQFIQNDDGFAIINEVWDLREMQSSDSRYKDAYGDFRQHIINNEDWSIDYIFIDRLNLLSGPDEKFLKFIEAFVDPKVRKDETFIEDQVEKINMVLQEDGYRLVKVNFFEGLPVYRTSSNKDSIDLPSYMLENDIRFFTSDAPGITYPCFMLKYNNWDDYTHKTSVYLEFCRTEKDRDDIGVTKIMSLMMDKSIWDILPKSFTVLPEHFCSFSEDEDYYFTLKRLFPSNFNSILHALRDAGLFPRISERFEETNIFKVSLIRTNKAEKLWREIRFKLAEIDMADAFKFRYDFKPPYAESGIDLDFNFAYGENVEIEHRIYVLIGKNGTGKTRILSGIANELAKERPQNIGPFKPLYSKIFTLSYSIFDKFDIQLGNSAFNYVYCGLKKNRTEHFTQQELRERLVRSAEVIRKRELANDWREILSNFIHPDVLDTMFRNKRGFYFFEPADLSASLDMLSSGQHILLYVLTEMLAQIRNDSLILYDEPETHLHPNAISELMNSILDLVKRFKSFCIIATHSPLIVQCIQSRNVYVINRNLDTVDLRLMDRESFGENLTVITEDIFGNRNIDKDYLLLLDELVEKGYSYRDIIAMLEQENQLPVNLNIRLHLKSLFPS